MNVKNYLLTISIISSALNASATSLEEALALAYQNNPELQSARENLKKTDEKIFSAISGFLPKLGYALRDKYGETDAANISGQTSYGSWYETKQKASGFVLDQNLFEGGKSIIALKVAKYTIDAERFNLISKEQDILYKAIDVYYSVMNSQEKLEMCKENLLAYEKKYQFVKHKFEQGFAKEADVANALAKKSDAEANLAYFDSNYRSAIAKYIEVIGIEPENLNATYLTLNMPKSEEELLQHSFKNNPELNRSLSTQKYLDLSIKYNLASMLPTVNLIAETSKTWEKKAAQTNTTPYINNRSISINVKVPLYQKGMEYSNVRSSKADASKAKYDNKNIKSQLQRKVTESWYELASIKKMVKSSQDSVKSGEIALAGKQKEYEEGLISLNELLEIQENLFKYKVRFVDNTKSLILKQYYIYSIEGSLTAKTLNLPTKLYNPAQNYDKIKTKLVGF